MSSSFWYGSILQLPLCKMELKIIPYKKRWPVKNVPVITELMSKIFELGRMCYSHYWIDFIDESFSSFKHFKNWPHNFWKRWKIGKLYIERESYNVAFLKVDLLKDTIEVNSICSFKTKFALFYCGGKKVLGVFESMTAMRMFSPILIALQCNIFSSIRGCREIKVEKKLMGLNN